MGLKADTEQTFGISLWKMQVLSVMFWGAGDREKALHILEAAEALADKARKKLRASSEKAEELEMPSFWRGMLVSSEQFTEDCEELRSMIKMGSSPTIRPPFLDDTFVI